MKIAILGAGNMGGVIARGLAQGGLVATKDITVTNPSVGKLDKLKAEYPEINVSTDNSVASEADMVIIAVKPWKVEEVVKPFAPSADSGICCRRYFFLYVERICR